MREVLFKDLTSVSSRKKDIFLKEVFEKDGVTAKTERRCFYLIKDVKELEGSGEIEKWLDSQDKTDGIGKRQFHIMKEHNDQLGEDKVMCKICGMFYAVVNNRIYTVGFLHSFKVCFTKPAMTQ